MMNRARFNLTKETLEFLSGQLEPELLESLKGLVGFSAQTEIEFLSTLEKLERPPASDREMALILRVADRHFSRAVVQLIRAFTAQTKGNLDRAESLYRKSIRNFPTAEAHTFLGWVLSQQERYDEAIAECHKAIKLDPEFGNPYHDIGAYLMVQGQYRQALPWLEQATGATRYKMAHFPYLAMGVAYEKLGQLDRALENYAQAYQMQPDDPKPLEAIERITGPAESLN